MANKRLFQIFSAVEAQPGVLASGLVAAANGKVQIKDPQFTFDVESYEREILRGSLSSLGTLAGKTECTVSFAVEMSGHTTAMTAPVWSPLMRACGFREVAMAGASDSAGYTFGGTALGAEKYLASGTFLVDNATPTIKVRLLHDMYEGQTAIYYEIVTGTPLSTTALFPDYSTVAIGPTILLDGGDPALQKGTAWYPISTAQISGTVATANAPNGLDDIYVGATSGAVIQALQATTAAAGQLFRLLDGTPTAAGETFNNKTQAGGSIVFTTPAWAQPRFPTISIALIEDGRIKIARGCRGTVSLSAERGKPVFLNFQFKGVLSSVGNAGPISGIAFASKVPKGFQGIGFLVGQYHDATGPGYYSHATAHTPRITSLSLDLGGGANVREDATSTTGVSGAAEATATRSGQGSMTVDVRPEASFPFMAKMTASEAFWLKFRLPGGTQNVFLVSAPGCVVTGAGSSDQNNFARDDISFSLSSMLPNLSDGDERELVISYHDSAASTW